MSEKQSIREWKHNIQVQEQLDGGFLILWRSLETGRMEHATVRETRKGTFQLIKKILG